MKRAQSSTELKLTDFFSKKPKNELSLTEQQSDAVADAEATAQMTDSMPSPCSESDKLSKESHSNPDHPQSEDHSDSEADSEGELQATPHEPADDGEGTASKHTDFPNVWSASQWSDKKKTYPWLECRNGKLGCTVCEKAQLSIHKQKGVSLATEWKTYSVSYNGSSRMSQLKSLRNKILKHKESSAHTTAMEICAKSDQQAIEKQVDVMNKVEIVKTEKVLRTAYFLAKEDRPYSDHVLLLELQEANGLDLGPGLRSRFTATNMIGHIATEMRQSACSHIQKSGGKISVLIDESTTVSNKSALIIYLKCQSEVNGEPHFMFLDLIELEDQSAATICQSLLRCLSCHGFDDIYLKNNLICFASDGASVMLGKKSGVASLLAEKYPNIIRWHCLNHRLELAVSSAIKEVTAVNHFQVFFDKLYTLYSRSPKNKHEIDSCAAELGLQLNKIGRIFNVRWVASSFRTVAAVWKDYPALCKHFQNAAADTNRSTQDRASFQGMLKRIQSPEFVVDLGVMNDALSELSHLSLVLQNRGTSIVYADKLMHRSIRVLESMIEKSGTKTKVAKDAADTMVFQNIALTKNEKLTTINEKQFLTSLVNNMTARLFTTQSSHVSSKTDATSDVSTLQYEQLVKQFGVLDEETWPTEIPPGFGENEIMQICERFHLSHSHMLTVNGYRDYLDNGGRKVPADLQPLVHCTHVIPCSTAECERGFSMMNIIVTDTRNKLLISHVSDLLFIKLHGPPVKRWNATKYTKTWLRKHRSAVDTQTRVVSAEAITEDPLWRLF